MKLSEVITIGSCDLFNNSIDDNSYNCDSDIKPRKKSVQILLDESFENRGELSLPSEGKHQISSPKMKVSIEINERFVEDMSASFPENVKAFLILKPQCVILSGTETDNERFSIFN